jgi:predicted permease
VPHFFEQRLSDLRYALRMMRKNPGFAAVAITSIGLGIGANTAIFTLVDTVLLKMLPVKDPQELALVARPPDRPGNGWSYPDYLAARDHNTGFTGLIAYGMAGPSGFSTGAPDAETTLARGVQVSGNYFGTLGVEPALGRLLNPEDDRAPGSGPNVVLSHAFWQSRFAGDVTVIGKTIRLNGYPFTVVGVSREGFTGVEVGMKPDFFVPLTMRTELTRFPNWNNRNNSWLRVLGRLKPGASIPQLETDLYSAGVEAEAQDRRTALNQKFVNRANKVKVMPGGQGYSGLRERLSQPLVVLMIVVGVVLLIACANVASLLIARAAARRQEIAVRLAVGSSRSRLIWQLLTESTILGILGGIAGLVFAIFGVQVLLRFLPQSGFVPIALDVSPDLRVLAFTLGVSIVTGALFGLIPALQSTKPDLVPALRQDAGSTGTRGGFRLRKGLVVAQVALSLLLLIGAGLFVRSLSNLKNLDAGFRKEHLLVIHANAEGAGYKGQRLRDLYENLRMRTEAIPGVRAATLARITPLGGARWNQDIRTPTYQVKPGEWNVVDQNAVSPRFFETLGIPILLGRDFRAEDNPPFTPASPDFRRPGAEPTAEEEAGPRVAIISESTAKKYFDGQNPVGMRFSYGDTYKAEKSFEVVGVVKDARYFGLRRETEPMIYQPIWRPGARGSALVIRTTTDPQRIVEAVRRELHNLDSSVPLVNTRTMEQEIDNNLLQERLVATLSGFFGVLALVLASVGLYGVIAHSAARRTREIGIRMALGAERASVLWLVLKEAVVLVSIGAVIGVPVALAVTKFASAFLYGVGARDPMSVVVATGFLITVAILAGYLPAYWASRMDPLRALRYE